MNLGVLMNNVMLDLETLGTNLNSVILSVGAVKFDSNGVTDSFYQIISLEDSLKKGFSINAKTLSWWICQNQFAKDIFINNGGKITDVLNDFLKFIKMPNLQIWGNGSDFDNTILQNYYNKMGVDKPWNYWENRCYRTIVNSFSSLNKKRGEDVVHHNALDDAKFQAECLIQIVENNFLNDVL
jgi:hypothetical protein